MRCFGHHHELKAKYLPFLNQVFSFVFLHSADPTHLVKEFFWLHLDVYCRAYKSLIDMNIESLWQIELTSNLGAARN